MKKDNSWQNITAEEMLEHSRRQKEVSITKPSDLAVRVGLLLLMPYIIWLSKYNDNYVASIHGKVIHLNFDGVMQSFHNLINGANMIVHEAGHGICYLLPCPQFFTALNGTLFQLALPLIFIYYYYKRENSTLAGIGAIWFAQNLIYVSWYMSTSHTPKLYPSFIPGSDIHDFWYIFSQLGVLEYDGFISGFVRIAAVMLLLASYMYLLYISFFQNSKIARRRSLKGRR